jgi:chromosome partitioning protein
MPNTITSKFKELVFRLFSSSKSIQNLAETSSSGSLYDFEGTIGGKKVGVIVRAVKAQMNAATLAKTLDKMGETDAGSLIIVALSGYFDTVYDYLDNHKINNVLLYAFDESSKTKLTQVWTHKGGRVKIEQPKEKAATEGASPKKTVRAKKAKKINIGVFTSKGGVGKTTISAHLAGALSIIGYESALIDLDPQSNLKKLIGDGGIYIKNRESEVGSCMSVLTAKEWDEKEHRDVKAVVCDCNPELDKNPTSFVKKFDFCIIPVTLNPLGINKHASVVQRTVKAIKDKNKKAKFLILINQYEPKEGKRNKILLELLRAEVDKMRESFGDIELIEPSDVAIRYSTQLFYWGMHTLTNELQSELAFEKVGARSIAKDDFFALAEYVASYASLKQ